MSSSSIGKDAITSTVNLLIRFKDAPISVEKRESSLVIAPTISGGYPITIYDEGDQAMIACERWHAHYDDSMQTAFCAMWLMTPYYRIVQEFKGGLIAAAWLERYEAEGWAPFEPAYFLNPEQAKEWEIDEPNGWIRHIRQQFVLPSPQAYASISPGAKLDENDLPLGAVHGVWTEEGDESIGLSLY